jgi:hypothetical protein
MNRSNFPPNRAPRTADQGIGTFVRRMAVGGEATMDPYFESLGFLPGEKELRTSGGNVLSALSAFDPVQGIMRGMTSAGVAADSRYSPEQRKEALIEAGLETIIPVSMIGAGKLAKEPAKKVLMDLFSPTGAPEEVSARPAAKAAPVDNTPDNPSRRKFLEGAGAAALAAGVTPDILAEIVPKITQAAARVAPDLLKNPLVMAAAKIKALKKSTDDLYASRGVISESTDSVADLARDRQLRANAYEKIDTFEDVFKSLADPKTGKQTIKEAPDDVLEEILSVQYEGSISLQKLLFRKLPRQGFDPATEIAQEIKRRGLDTAANKEGILQFPYARQFMEDVLEEGGMSKNAAKWNPEDQIYDPTLFEVTKNIRGFGPTSNIAAESIPPKIAKVFHTTKTKNYAGEDVLDFSLGPDSLDKALPTGNYGPAIYFSPDVSYPKQLNTSNSRMVEADIDESNFLNIRDNAPVADFQRDAFLDTIDTLSDAKGNAPKVEYNPENNTAKISLVQTEKSVGTREGPYELTINFNKPEKFFNGVKDLAYRIRSAADGDNRANMVEIFKSSKIPGILGGYAQEGHIGVFDPSVIKSQSTAQRYAEGGPVGIGTLSNTAKNMFQEAVEPFDPEKHSPIQTAGQSTATEYTSTTESPDGDVWNIPQIWFSVETGEPVLKTGDDAWAAAYEYEKQTGKMFPRFNSIPEAESAAQSRSDQGGASEQPLARMDGGPVYGIGSLNQTARNMFR